VLEDVAGIVPIALTLPVVYIKVVGEAGVLDFLGGLDSSLVEGETSNSIWLVHSIQASRVDFIC